MQRPYQEFTDAEAASNSLHDFVERQVASDQFDEIGNVPDYGVESFAYVQTAHWDAQNVDLVYQTYVLRVDGLVGVVQVLATEALPVAALSEFASAQTDCLTSADCSTLVSLPRDLQEMVDHHLIDLQTAPEPRNRHSPPVIERTYVGANYDVELTYNLSDWELLYEDSSGGQDVALFFEDREPATVALMSQAAGEAVETCVAEEFAGVADDEAYGRVKPMLDAGGDPIAGADRDRAFAAYGFHGAGLRTFMYIECRVFADGEAMLFISHSGPLADYDARAEARETLLDGLDLPGA